jgi:DinB superfamily
VSDFAAYTARLLAPTAGKDPLALQSEAVATIEKLLDGVPEEVLRRRPQPGKWSVVEILAHLAEDELATSWRYRQMLENDGGPLASFDQDRWAEWGDYASWDPASALALFRLLRDANLRLLRSLDATQLRASGVHAERGPLTVADLARHMAGHDLNHLEQIRSLVAR